MSRAERYAQLFDVAGRRVTLERPITNAEPLVASVVRARLSDAQPIEVGGGVTSTARRVLVLAADVPEALRPLRKGDCVLVDGIRLRFRDRPDDQTHRDGETLLAFDGWAAGG